MGFFTKRTKFASRWLRFTARTLQACGILGGAVSLLALAFIAAAQSGRPAALGGADNLLRNRTIWIFGQCLSLYFIGLALLRRQRWAAYVALGTIAVPAVMSQVSLTRRGLHYPPLLTVLPLLTVALIASVWRELGSVRDSDVVEHRPEPDPEIPITPRNRGYGELRSTSRDPMPVNTTTAHSEESPSRSRADE